MNIHFVNVRTGNEEQCNLNSWVAQFSQSVAARMIQVMQLINIPVALCTERRSVDVQ